MGFSLFGFGKKKDMAQDAPVAPVMPAEPEASEPSEASAADVPVAASGDVVA